MVQRHESWQQLHMPGSCHSSPGPKFPWSKGFSNLTSVGSRRPIGFQLAYREVSKKYFYLPLLGHPVAIHPTVGYSVHSNGASAFHRLLGGMGH